MLIASFQILILFLSLMYQFNNFNCTFSNLLIILRDRDRGGLGLGFSSQRLTETQRGSLLGQAKN